MQQLKSRFDGRVQGVGFRATVVDIASRLDVVGWVRNSPDGSVEMLAQGREAELLSLQSQIRVRFDRNIVSENSDWQDLDQLAFESFDIAF